MSGIEIKELINSFENKELGYIPCTKEFLYTMIDRIEFLEARQTELQEEGTKLVTERRELKAEIAKLKAS